MNKNSQELLTEKPFNIMLKLSLPAILGMIVIGLYPLMDGIFAGQILGGEGDDRRGNRNAVYLY